jgi:hypothetical protein
MSDPAATSGVADVIENITATMATRTLTSFFISASTCTSALKDPIVG